MIYGFQTIVTPYLHFDIANNVLFFQFCVVGRRHNHPQEEWAKFGHKLDTECKIFF
jgi:hypothetical protein